MKGSAPTSVTGAATLVLVGLVAITSILWRNGRLQALDFALYDRFIEVRDRGPATASPVVLVGITEEDIHRHDHPIPDQLLAQLLDLIAAGNPRVIGLDIYRNLPEPRSGAEVEILNNALIRLTNVIAIQKLPDATRTGTPPPKALENYPDRVGFNNFPLDNAIGSKVRRGLLFAGADPEKATPSLYSLPLRLALTYLEQDNILPEPSPANPEHLRLGEQDYPPLSANTGAYVNVDAQGYQLLLDFLGPASFDACRFSDVIRGEVRPGFFTDKVVIIGATTESIKDHHLTPLNRQVYGVELHARLADQLIRGAYGKATAMRSLHEWAEAGLMISCCLLGVAVPIWIRSVPGALGLIILGVVLLFALNHWGFRAGLWIPIAPSLAASIPAAMLMTSHRLARERRDRSILMQLFSQHVSPEIAKVLWEQRHTFLEGQTPRPRALTVTILFADLRGFSSVASQLPAPLLMGWLNRYLESMSTEILARGGIVNEFIGDGIMATFGIPIPRKTEAEIDADARNAVGSAIAMAARLEELNRRWKAKAHPTAMMRIGIYTGPVVTGTVGGLDRLKFAVVGDAVNAAERLESFDKEFNAAASPIPNCRILVAEPTWARLNGQFDGQQVGDFVLKGRQERTTIHQVFGTKPKDPS